MRVDFTSESNDETTFMLEKTNVSTQVLTLNPMNEGEGT